MHTTAFPIPSFSPSTHEALDLPEASESLPEARQDHLQRCERRFRAILDSSRLPIFIAVGRRLVYVNPAFVTYFGYSQNDLVGGKVDLEALVHEGSVPLMPSMEKVGELLLADMVREVQKCDPPSATYTIAAKLRHDQRVDFEVRVAPMWWGESDAVLGSLYARTEPSPIDTSAESSSLESSSPEFSSAESSEMKRQATLDDTFIRSLLEANRNLEETAETLRISNTKLRHFGYRASHDLQEPLRTVSSFLQLFAGRYRGRLDADADEFINFAVEGTKRMKGLLDALLVHAQAKHDELRLEEVDVGELLAQVRDNLHLKIAETKTELSWTQMPTLKAEAAQLLLVFQNLVANAIKFNRQQVAPRVEVIVEQRATSWLFTVRDNGLGIDPIHQDRIFAMFQRLNDRSRYPGTGLGLSICKEIVERHGGCIWVESRLGEGSSFNFSIPFDSHEPISGEI